MHPLSVSRFRSSRHAFSMVEILVTTAIMGVLAALLVGGMKGAADRGKEAKCVAGLRQIGVGIMNYVGDNNGFLPRPTIKAEESGLGGDQMWSKQLGPYLPQRSNSATAPQNLVFVCPAADYQGYGTVNISSTYNSSSVGFHFTSSTSTGSASSGPARSLGSVENPSKTILVAEGKQAGSAASCTSSLNWTQASADLEAGSPAQTANLDFRHADKMNVLYCDGHVGTIPFEDRANITRSNWEGRNYNP
jgi:prepilin-type processing-associated H-X9-DG protein/prepilin-type N-terminal cleavage/methylation domain-containing protein